MAEEDSSENELRVMGVKTGIKIVPDYQHTELKELADDALRLFWVSIVTMGLFIPVFAVLLKTNYEIIQRVLSDKYLTTGVLFAMVSMGSTLFAYGYARSKRGDGIPSSQFLEMKEKVDTEIGEVALPERKQGDTAFSNYFLQITEFNHLVRRTRISLLLGMYTLYLSVAFLVMSIINIFISLPKYFIFGLVGLPILSAIILSVLLSSFSGSPDGYYLGTVSEDESTSEK